MEQTAKTRERARESALDGPEVRPGVPKAEPDGSRAEGEGEPIHQAGAEHHLRRAELEVPTPVFGTAQPPHGLSGLLRRRAYDVPERHARHWMLLILADRVDVLEDRLGSALAGPLEAIGWTRGSRWARENPLGALGALAGAVWAARCTLGRRRGRG
jgi:hypothetical protein